jgi:tetratricopeptide (TPR) repeat protein
MADLRVCISADTSGWQFQWYQDGVLTGDPVSVSLHVANELGYLGSAIAQAFEDRSSDGFVRLPFLACTALDHMGIQLRDRCCGPITQQLNAGGTHRLTVVSDQARALNLPWELLPVGGERLGSSTRWGVFRTPDKVPTSTLDRRGPPLRIVFLAAAPQDQVPLDYEKEEEAILRATVALKGAQLFTAELGTYDELDDLLQQVKPHVVHLSGHGIGGSDGVGRFCFEDDAGQADQRDAKALAQLFEKRHVPFVFLNGCQTAQAAVAGLCQALTKAGLPLALGWAASVADERATAFAGTFYRELLGGEPVPVPVAAALARQRIQQDGFRPSVAGQDAQQELTFLLPQLYAAQPVEVLFDPQAPAEAFQGVATRYELLSGDMAGLRRGFVGRRREQQQLLPALRAGDITVLLLHGVGGQGKSTLATRLVGRLRGSGFDVRVVKTVRPKDEAIASCAARASAAIVKEISLAATKLGDDHLGNALGNEDRPLARRLLEAADALMELKCVLVLDNFEDVLEHRTDGGWHIADAGLAEFYSRVQTQLTQAEGGRVVVTSRYLPAGTNTQLATVRVLKGLADFKNYEFFKLLKRDERVAERINAGELPLALLDALYHFAGGTPRFLERLRTLLRKLSAKQLEDALQGGSQTLVQERDQYLQDHCGPQLWDKLTPATRGLLSRLGLSENPLSEDALASLTGLDANSLEGAVNQGVDFGLLQVFEEIDPKLYLPPGVWRGWLTDQLTESDRRAAHGVLATFWRTVFEKHRGPELRITIIDGLLACRSHGKQAGSSDLWHWASTRLSTFWERIAEWRAARAVLEEIPESERDALVWHMLATLDMNEGDYPAAREQFGKALAMRQQFGDRAGEATTWHQLASIDVEEGNYAAAREQFGKALAMRQQIDDRAGEATTWHQFATMDLSEGNYAAAREKFGKSLAIKQQIGDRAGEANSWHQLATIDVYEGNYAAAREQFGKALTIKQQIGDRAGEAATWHQLATIDLHEGNYAAAREQFGKSLAIEQQIGNRAGEAQTFAQLAVMAFQADHLVPASKLAGLAFLLSQAIGHFDVQQTGKNFLVVCSHLGLSEPQIQALLQEIAQSYQRDRGRALLLDAFPDWP